MSEFRGTSEDDIIHRIAVGGSISKIAEEFAVHRSVLWKWLEADEKRSARAKEAREHAAEAFDDQAERGIADAFDPFELAKAKERAHHLRWRASKIAPKRYGEKLQVEAEVSTKTTTDEQLLGMLAKFGISVAVEPPAETDE